MSTRKKRKKQGKNIAHGPVLKNYSISAKTPGQKEYLKTINENEVTICLGEAGTGKTYLASSWGIVSLMQNKYEKLVISRPLVQSGADMGYLPGGINQKLQPYLEPIYDELEHYASRSDIYRLQNSGKIKVVPFGFMRGRNFHDSFIIVDEVQNCSESELKLLLTRLGMGSKMVLTGDTKQSDLAVKDRGAIEKYSKILENVDNVGICRLGTSDIVRNPTVEKILLAVEQYEKGE